MNMEPEKKYMGWPSEKWSKPHETTSRVDFDFCMPHPISGVEAAGKLRQSLSKPVDFGLQSSVTGERQGSIRRLCGDRWGWKTSHSWRPTVVRWFWFDQSFVQSR